MLAVDPDSRVPERRAVLTPFEADEPRQPAASASRAAPRLAGPAGARRPSTPEVVAVRESWLIEDRWWTDRPLRRRYWEVVTLDGRDLVVFRELDGGGWYRHR